MFSNLFKKRTKITREFTTRMLTLNLESGWIEDTSIEEPLTLIRESNGKGALQVSLATIRDPRIPSKDEIFRQHGNAKNIKEYSIREWKIYEFEEPTKELYNKTIFLVKQGVIVFFTWYGSFESKNSKELEEAIRMVHSVSVSYKN